MTKCALIINTPIKCSECPLFQDDYMCIITGKTEDEEHICPLIELPRLTNSDDANKMMCRHSSMVTVYGYNKNALARFIDGWESCLDELEGKQDGRV